MMGNAMKDPKVRYLLMLQTVWIFFMQIIVSQWKR
jgi:hypothetical protein